MADSTSKYIETVGRRKTSIARVRMTEAPKNSFLVNEKEIEVYFPTAELRKVAKEALVVSKLPQKFKITVHVKGGGISSQADAVRHGIARALVKSDENMRKVMKDPGFLKRDPRSKERRKFGLKKARKAPQWSKR
jgi:small subunit ribosomal protein S9